MHLIAVRWVLPIIGAVLIITSMADLELTLFHPAQHGNVSEAITFRVWRLIRRFAPQQLSAAGPLNFLIVIAYWGLSVIGGFTLIYAPFMATQFVVAPGLDAGQLARYPLAYAGTLSLSALITVPTGITTKSVLVQYAMGIEAVLGFVILTASISWILSIYPVLEHRRSMAHEATLLHFAEAHGVQRVDDMAESDLQDLLLALSEQITTIRTELSQFPITYYFHQRDERSTVAPALQYLAELAEDVARERPGARIGATVMGGAIDDLLEMMAKKYLKRSFPSRWEALAALLKDHRREALHRPKR